MVLVSWCLCAPGVLSDYSRWLYFPGRQSKVCVYCSNWYYLRLNTCLFVRKLFFALARFKSDVRQESTSLLDNSMHLKAKRLPKYPCRPSILKPDSQAESSPSQGPCSKNGYKIPM